MDSLALLPAAVEGGDWQDIRELVERTGEALRLSSVSPSRIPELAQQFLRLSRHENWQVRKAVAHAALYLRHDLFHGIIANLIDDDNLWVRDIARKTLVRRSELSRAEVRAQDPFDADAALLDEIESRYGVKARRSVVAAASKLHHRFVKEIYHEIIRILSPLDTCLLNLERELSGKPGLEQAAERIRRGHHHVGLISGSSPTASPRRRRGSACPRSSRRLFRWRSKAPPSRNRISPSACCCRRACSSPATVPVCCRPSSTSSPTPWRPARPQAGRVTSP